MLTSGGVPNTYAAGLATLAIGLIPSTPPAAEDQLGPSSFGYCDCGRPLSAKRKTQYDSCTRCHALDGAADNSNIDRAVLDVLDADTDLAIDAIVEELSYRYPHKVVYYAVRRLVKGGKVVRRRAPMRSEGHLYRKVSSP